MPWSCLLCPSGRPSSSHPDPQLGVASIGGQPGLQGTEGHSLGRGIPGWREPGGARKDNGEEEECIVFLTRPLTIASFIPVRLINVFLNSSPYLFQCLLCSVLVSLKCPSLPNLKMSSAAELGSSRVGSIQGICAFIVIYLFSLGHLSL